MLEIIKILFLACVLAWPVSASPEDLGMMRKHMHSSPKKTYSSDYWEKRRTENFKLPCVMVEIQKAECLNDRWYLKTGNKPILVMGVKVNPSAGKGEGLRFLNQAVAGKVVKVCHPKMEGMDRNNIWGLIFIEPVLKSLQEILLDAGFATYINQ